MKEMKSENSGMDFKFRDANGAAWTPSKSLRAEHAAPDKKASPATVADRMSRSFWGLDADALCAEARKRTGLHDFGDPPLEPGLSILINSLEQQADLKPFGRFLMRTHLMGLLETRLRLTEAWKQKRNSLEAEPIRKPIFIVGMPRSGSTFLHELLAEDPRHRAPLAWEVMFPLADQAGDSKDEARRIRKAEFCLWCFRRLAPQADEVYPMRGRTPHECVAIHSYTFLSEEFVSTCRVNDYETFLHSTDLTPAYRWQKRFLQHLQSESQPRRWVLKSPDHVYGLEELFATFPDASIVQTHRNPLQVLKSSADVTWVLRGLYGRPDDREAIRAREARVLADGTERFIQFRDAHPELANRFVDVKYTDIVADPVQTVRRIYEQLDHRLSDEAAQRMQALASRRTRYRGKRSSEEPNSKQDATVERNRFERYCVRFGLSSP